MPNERIDPSSPLYLSIIFFFLFFAGAMIVLLGRSTIKRRRLSNSRKLYFLTGVSEYQGTTAVVLGKIIEIFGYFWLAGTCLILLGMGVSQLFRRNGDSTLAAGESGSAAMITQEEMEKVRRKKAEADQPTLSKGEEVIRAGKQAEEEFRRRTGTLGMGGTPSNDTASPGYATPGNSAPVDSAPDGVTPPAGGSSYSTPRARSAHPLRQWTSADGKFSTTASLIEQVGNEVHLKKEDGATIKVDKSKLSAADQAWLAKNP